MTPVRTATNHDQALATGLVLAAIGTAVGSFWLITGPGAADSPRSGDPISQQAPQR